MDTRKGCYGSSQWFLVSLAAKCRPNIRVFCVLKRDEWMMLIRKKWSYRQGPVEICFSFFSFDISWVFTCWFPWCSFPFVPPCLLHVPLLICHVCSIPRTKPAKTEANESKNEHHQWKKTYFQFSSLWIRQFFLMLRERNERTIAWEGSVGQQLTLMT